MPTKKNTGNLQKLIGYVVNIKTDENFYQSTSSSSSRGSSSSSREIIPFI